MTLDQSVSSSHLNIWLLYSMFLTPDLHQHYNSSVMTVVNKTPADISSSSIGSATLLSHSCLCVSMTSCSLQQGVSLNTQILNGLH